VKLISVGAIPEVTKLTELIEEVAREMDPRHVQKALATAFWDHVMQTFPARLKGHSFSLDSNVTLDSSESWQLRGIEIHEGGTQVHLDIRATRPV
jgi:hypothetical protein